MSTKETFEEIYGRKVDKHEKADRTYQGFLMGCNYRQKEIDVLGLKIKCFKTKLESERESIRFFSDALNEERLRHGATERKLAEAVEIIRYLDGRFKYRDYGYISNLGSFEKKGFEDITSEFLETIKEIEHEE